MKINNSDRCAVCCFATYKSAGSRNNSFRMPDEGRIKSQNRSEVLFIFCRGLVRVSSILSPYQARLNCSKESMTCSGFAKSRETRRVHQ